jgi:hypothetical protein
MAGKVKRLRYSSVDTASTVGEKVQRRGLREAKSKRERESRPGGWYQSTVDLRQS